MLQRPSGGNDLCGGETLFERAHTEPVVAMPMRNVNGGQCLVGRSGSDPVGEGGGLFRGKEGVDDDGFVGRVDESGCAFGEEGGVAIGKGEGDLDGVSGGEVDVCMEGRHGFLGDLCRRSDGGHRGQFATR